MIVKFTDEELEYMEFKAGEIIVYKDCPYIKSIKEKAKRIGTKISEE